MSAWENVMRIRCPKDTDPARRSLHVAYDVRLPLDITALNAVVKGIRKCACGAALVLCTDPGDPR
jgi:hypothetical protein